MSATLPPLTPNWIDPPTPAKDLIDRVLDTLEKTTTADKIHTKKVELGWISPDGCELSWRHWQSRAPNYRPRGGNYQGVNVYA